MINTTLLLLQMAMGTLGYLLFTYFCWITENWTFFWVSHLAFFGLMVIAYAI